VCKNEMMFLENGRIFLADQFLV